MTSSSECEILQPSQIIRERWKIKQKVGGGGFGEIYEAVDLQNHNERVAIKVESSKATKQVLKMEVAVLRRLQGKKHACKFYACGRNEKFNYLVMSLQGKNLADLRRESPSQRFSTSTALRVSQQILQSIKEIHSIGFLHRDIKPSNFAVGRTLSSQHNIYMLDFGLARLFLNAKGEVRTPRSAAGFRGTVRYAALSAHKNKEMGRQDDLWSLFYMLVEFLNGSLPWRRIKDKDEVGRMKDEVDIRELLEGNPPELQHFADHLKGLAYPDMPNYELLENCLIVAMKRLGIGPNDPFDWENNFAYIMDSNSKISPNPGQMDANGQRQKSSQIGRSYTTAFREHGPENKGANRGLDTQAPMTGSEMTREDCDEQTGNFPNVAAGPGAQNNNNSYYEEGKGGEFKPKYKRQEFMRPKINQNLGKINQQQLGKSIDVVNERFKKVQSNSPVPIGKRYQNGSKISPNFAAPASSVSNFSRSEDKKMIVPERRAESMQPATPVLQPRNNINTTTAATTNVLTNATNGPLMNGQVAFPLPPAPPSSAFAVVAPSSGAAALAFIENGGPQKQNNHHQTTVPYQKDYYGSLQQLNSAQITAPILKIAGVPAQSSAQKFAQKEMGNACGSPSKSPSTPALQREGSRERLNKYAAAGSPAIYQQERQEKLHHHQQQQQQQERRQSSPQKYAVKGGGGGGEKGTSGRRSSRDAAAELLGGSNLISHFKNLVNSFNSLSMANKSGRSKSLSRGMSSGDKHGRQQQNNAIMMTPIGKGNGGKSSSKLAAPSNEDTSATSGIGSASPTIRNKSREAADADEHLREQMRRRRREQQRRSVERRAGTETTGTIGNGTIGDGPNLAQAALVEQYTKELMRVGQQQDQRRQIQIQQQQQQQRATILLKHNGRYLGNL